MSKELAEELSARITGLTRQNAAKTVHEWLRKVRPEPDEPDIEAALRLRDIYDCHACVEHVAQVYVKGIMTARGGLFGMKEELSGREAAEIAERAVNPAKRVRVDGVKAENPSPQPDDGATIYDVIIDVRSREEFAEGHRKGAVNVPLADYLEDPVTFVAEKDAAILFVCQRGIKSRIAAEAAIRHGFRNVRYAGDGFHE